MALSKLSKDIFPYSKYDDSNAFYLIDKIDM